MREEEGDEVEGKHETRHVVVTVGAVGKVVSFDASFDWKKGELSPNEALRYIVLGPKVARGIERQGRDRRSAVRIVS